MHPNNQLRDKVGKLLILPHDPEKVIEKLDSFMKEYDQNMDDDSKEKYVTKLRELSDEYARLDGLNNHLPMVETLTINRTMIVEIANKLALDYPDPSTTEKMLIELVVGSYGRIIEFSKLLNNCQRVDSLSDIKTNYYRMLDKSLDRAYRQFNSAVMTLQTLRTPPLNVKIVSTNAVVAQNQQINLTQNETH